MEYPEFDKEDSLLAVLCYIPFFMLSLIVPLFILVSKGKSAYARFHALQSLVLHLCVVGINFVLSIVALIVIMLLTGLAIVSTQNAGLGFFAMYGSLFLAIIPSVLFSFAMLLFNLYLAYGAMNGHRVNIPFVTRFVLARFQ